MRKEEIRVGKVYRVNSLGSKKVKVVSLPKRSHGQTYNVEVEFPDEPGDRKGKIATREFDRLWTDEDDAKLQRQRDEKQALEQLDNRLTFAGYHPDRVYRIRRDGEFVLALSFSGDVASKLVNTLTGNVEDDAEEKARSDSDA
jgi:hypothetical protein